jgi:hypothetical protein
MKKVNTRYLFNRKGVYYFRMAVPKRLVAKYGKREIVRTLNTGSLNDAIIMVATLAAQYEGEFKSGNIPQIDLSIATLRATAQRLQATYAHPDLFANAPLEQVIAATGPGLESIGRIANPDRVEIAAIGGVLDQPVLTMRQALEQFQTDSGDLWLDLSHRERQKKWNKYKEAVTDWEAEMGADLDVLKITKKEVYRYRDKLLDRVKAKTLKIDTIRKKLMWLRVVVRHSYDLESMKDSPFENLRPIKGIADEEKRAVISENEVIAIRKHYDEVGANDELVAIMAVIENTGTSAKEVVLLAPENIHLDAPIPYVSFEPNDNRSILKTDNRVRKVPLVGIALDAMKRFPRGFPRYCRDNGNEALSAAANKLIKPVAPGKTTYGYRHRMSDLMKAKGIEDSLRDSIMGWGSDGKMNAYYGTEYPLEVKLEVLKKVLPDHAYKTQL